MEKSITRFCKFQNEMNSSITITSDLIFPRKKFLYANVVVHTGSLMDNANLGIAHFTEHMLLSLDKHKEFKSEQRKFRLSGVTSYDRTRYQIITSDDYVDEALIILENVIHGKYLTPNLLEVIREEILKEYQNKINNGEVKMISKVLEDTDLSKKHPIGQWECIKKIQYNDIINFFETNYKDDNICLNVATDLSLEIILKKISTAFRTQINRVSNNLTDEFSIGLEPIKQSILRPSCNIIFEKGSLRIDGNIHVYIRSDTMCFSSKDSFIESMALSIGEDILKESSLRLIEIKVHQFSKKYRYIHLIFDTSIENLKNNLYDVFKQWLEICKNERIFYKAKLEYLKVVDKFNLPISQILKAIEDSFIYNESCYFTDQDIKEKIYSLKPSDIYDFVYQCFLTNNVYIFESKP